MWPHGPEIDHAARAEDRREAIGLLMPSCEAALVVTCRRAVSARHGEVSPSLVSSRNGVSGDVSGMASLNFASWNRTVSWLRQLDAIRAVA